MTTCSHFPLVSNCATNFPDLLFENRVSIFAFCKYRAPDVSTVVLLAGCDVIVGPTAHWLHVLHRPGSGLLHLFRHHFVRRIEHSNSRAIHSAESPANASPSRVRFPTSRFNYLAGNRGFNLRRRYFLQCCRRPSLFAFKSDLRGSTADCDNSHGTRRERRRTQAPRFVGATLLKLS